MAYLRIQENRTPNSGKDRLKAGLLIIFLLLTVSIRAQLIEFGGGVGVLNYSGDLIRGYQVSNIKPALTAHYRMNFSKELSLKWQGVLGTIQSQDVPIDNFAALRNYSYSLRVGEISSVVEYHFLDYKHEKSLIRWSPYAFGGFGIMRVLRAANKRDEYNTNQAVVPFGLGFKQLVGKRFSLDAEFGVRKTYFDWLDNTSDSDLSIKDYQYGNPNDNDWYTFFGVTLSFILYEIPCPFPYEPNKYMLKAKFR
jgi:hypothetical protein